VERVERCLGEVVKNVAWCASNDASMVDMSSIVSVIYHVQLTEQHATPEKLNIPPVLTNSQDDNGEH